MAAALRHRCTGGPPRAARARAKVLTGSGAVEALEEPAFWTSTPHATAIAYLPVGSQWPSKRHPTVPPQRLPADA